jgi:hypothetical protein
MTLTPEQNAEAFKLAEEALAAEFGISVAEVRRRVALDLERQAIRRANIPEWVKDMALAVPTSTVRGVVAEQRTSSVNQGPSMAGVSGQVVRTSVAPGLFGTTAWSQSGNAGRW